MKLYRSYWLTITAMAIIIGAVSAAAASNVVPQTFTEDQRGRLNIEIAKRVQLTFCSPSNTDMCSIYVVAPAIQMSVDAFERLLEAGNHDLLSRIIEENPDKSFSVIEKIFNKEAAALEDDW